MKITDVIVHQIRGRFTGPTFPPGNRQAKQIDVYAEFNRDGRVGTAGPERTSDDDRPIVALYVEIATDQALSGLWGPIDEYQLAPIRQTLRPFLIGRDPLATELLYDLMIRLDRHGRSGYFMTAVSAIDCALWDLKGKAWREPVYRLLGGPVRTSVPAYASMLGFSTRPEDAAATAVEYKSQGYGAQKWFFRYGPGDGADGMALNLALAHAVREAVGPDYRLMFDAFMGWDTTYAVEMVKRLAAVNPTWMEEPIPPEKVGGLAKIRRASSVPIATGEHVYTRWQVKELLVCEAVDYLQNDPDWVGITELSKICALASAFETPVVAHGHSLLPALHLAGAQSPNTVPYVEYLIRYQETKQFFHKSILRPKDGNVPLPDGVGLGFDWDEAKIESRTVVE